MTDASRASLIPALPQPWLVICDLDGTLLDHHDYSHAAADPVLAALEAQQIPVVFNTSKTFTEVVHLRRALNNRHPFIVENGSAIYLPDNYFAEPAADAQPVEGYQRLPLGRPRQDILAWLENAGKSEAMNFIGFASMSVEQVAAMTGLDAASAARAAKREFSEALCWLGSESAKAEFCRQARQAGFRILQGGRFLHLLGDCDKGRASVRLAREYRVHGQEKASLIAAGDSGNDVAMLAVADLAILVRSPVQDFPSLPEGIEHCLRSRGFGPQGWAELMGELLKTGSRGHEAKALRSEL